MSFRFICIIFIVFLQLSAEGQYVKNDSISKKEWRTLQKESKEPFYPKPGKSALLSALIPGGGQFYNRSYWKVPIVLGGGALFYYFIDVNKGEFDRFDDAIVTRNNATNSNNIPFPTLSDNDLEQLRDDFQNQFELSIIGASIFYLITIGDAFVDAHLKEFDINDDLSLEIEPSLLSVGSYRPNALGVQFTLNLK